VLVACGASAQPPSTLRATPTASAVPTPTPTPTPVPTPSVALAQAYLTIVAPYNIAIDKFDAAYNELSNAPTLHQLEVRLRADA
jgi:hypothetical protein